MKASELRNFGTDELKARIAQWEMELFQSRFKRFQAEFKDTSVFAKLRQDIARGKTILREKSNAPQDKGATKAQAEKKE